MTDPGEAVPLLSLVRVYEAAALCLADALARTGEDSLGIQGVFLRSDVAQRAPELRSTIAGSSLPRELVGRA